MYKNKKSIPLLNFWLVGSESLLNWLSAWSLLFLPYKDQGILPFTQSNPYLKFLDFSQLLVADTPMKYTLSQHFWNTQYKNYFDFFPFIKNLFTSYLKLFLDSNNFIFYIWDPCEVFWVSK